MPRREAGTCAPSRVAARLGRGSRPDSAILPRPRRLRRVRRPMPLQAASLDRDVARIWTLAVSPSGTSPLATGSVLGPAPALRLEDRLPVGRRPLSTLRRRRAYGRVHNPRSRRFNAGVSAGTEWLSFRRASCAGPACVDGVREPRSRSAADPVPARRPDWRGAMRHPFAPADPVSTGALPAASSGS